MHKAIEVDGEDKVEGSAEGRDDGGLSTTTILMFGKSDELLFLLNCFVCKAVCASDCLDLTRRSGSGRRNRPIRQEIEIEIEGRKT